jgi:hypothetical protein
MLDAPTVMPSPEAGSGEVGGGAVIGWVHGVPVPVAALGPYLSELAVGTAGTRLGVTDEPELVAAQSPAKTQALRTWGAKALLVDTLLQQEAARLGVTDLSSAAEWQARLEAGGELADAAPTEAELRSVYSANRHRFELPEARRVRHVLVVDRATAERLYSPALDASDVAALAPQWSVDRGSRDRGGDMGWVERGQLAGPLEEAIFGASAGRVIGPVASAFGWHLLVVEEIRPQRAPTFEECRAQLETELIGTRRRRSLLAWVDHRVAEAVRVPKGAEHPLYRGLPGSHHRH